MNIPEHKKPPEKNPLSHSPPFSKFQYHIPEQQLVLTEKIPVKTYHGEMRWIQFKRGPIYKEVIDIDDEPEIDEDGFQIVKHKKSPSKPQNIYYWYLNAHNLYPFDCLKAETSIISRPWSKFKKYNLYFCQPDYQIYQNDSCPQYAVDPNAPNVLVPLVFYAKCNKVKFKPITFIAKTEEQIKTALQHISYCVVKEIGDDRLQIMSEDDLRNEVTAEEENDNDME